MNFIIMTKKTIFFHSIIFRIKHNHKSKMITVSTPLLNKLTNEKIANRQTIDLDKTRFFKAGNIVCNFFYSFSVKQNWLEKVCNRF